MSTKEIVIDTSKISPYRARAIGRAFYNAYLDSELEQLLCFDTEIDAEVFCSRKSAIFVIMPEENPNTFFM